MSSRIKSETIYRIDHVAGEEIDLEQEFDSMQSYHEFDEAGRLVLEIDYTRDGDIADKMEHRYDSEGKLIETCIFGEDDEILERKEMIWGTGNRVMREIIHYLDGSEDIHEFYYDDKGDLTGIQVKDEEDDLEFEEKYFYENGKVVLVERWNEEEEVIFRQEDEYENGIIRTRTIWSAEEEEPFTIIQRFNAAGYREEELRYDKNENPTERNIYETDEKGQVMRMVEENRQRKNTTEFSYDEQGNVVYQKETDLHGDINHEIFRLYGPEGEPVKTTVEVVIKPSMEKRAYTLVFQREMY